MKTKLIIDPYTSTVDGSKNVRVFYVLPNGERHGLYRCWSAKGILILNQNYHLGMEVGLKEWYYKDGVRRRIECVKDEEYYGVMVEFGDLLNNKF